MEEAIVRRVMLYAPCLLLSILSCHIHLSGAADSIPPGAKLHWNQTLISAGGAYELGFYSPGNSGRYYVCIWYQRISVRTPVWVANRETPIRKPEESFLNITGDGNLALFSAPNTAPIWSSNVSSTTSTTTNTTATLLDTGNLVLLDSENSSIVRWQTFDYPTDTWLPGARMGMNKVTGQSQVFTSWKNSEDPAPGRFSMSLDPDGTNQVVLMWNRSEKYWTSGVWNGEVYTGDAQLRTGSVNYKLFFIDNPTEKYNFYRLNRNTTLGKVAIAPSGQLTLYFSSNLNQPTFPVWFRPMTQCDVYSLCGANGACGNGAPACQCPSGFRPVSEAEWGLNDWSSGCVRRTNLGCAETNSSGGGGAADGFLAMPSMRKPENPHVVAVGGAEECRSTCLRNCSCTAFTYDNGCSIWIGDLWNLGVYTSEEDANSNATLYVRVAASELVTKKRNHKTIIAVVAAVALAAVIVGSLVAWAFRRSRRPSSLEAIDVGTLTQFSYSSLQQVTKNFSDRLGGGSFGSVFKGTFPDSTEVAVKKLEHYGQGEKQFLAEVSSLGTIQHVNLVRLHGFCSEKQKRLLVYEYMPNGSLASRLFCESSLRLDWKRRYTVALETAKGLAYLHDECRYCIIHCDVKPENILLDEEYRPKVADLGLAKLLGRDFSRVLTTMRGTIGYLAPEWISGMPITQKADVYSYGMMLFEIISGKRNTEHTEDAKGHFFPIWATKQINNGEYLNLADESLQGAINKDELMNVCKAACWCIQDEETNRPTMRQVVQILEGVLEVGVPPVPILLHSLMEAHDANHYFQRRSKTSFFGGT